MLSSRRIALFISAFISQRLGSLGYRNRTNSPTGQSYLMSTVGWAKLSEFVWTFKKLIQQKQRDNYSRRTNISFPFQSIRLCSSVFTHHHTPVNGIFRMKDYFRPIFRTLGFSNFPSVSGKLKTSPTLRNSVET